MLFIGQLGKILILYIQITFRGSVLLIYEELPGISILLCSDVKAQNLITTQNAEPYKCKVPICSHWKWTCITAITAKCITNLPAHKPIKIIFFQILLGDGSIVTTVLVTAPNSLCSDRWLMYPRTCAKKHQGTRMCTEPCSTCGTIAPFMKWSEYLRGFFKSRNAVVCIVLSRHLA